MIVVGVGAQKCATSSIHSFLGKNGAITPGPKELHAFNSNLFTSRKKYLKLLGFKQDGKTYLEFTPNYLSQPTSIWNLAKVVPDARIIVSLRDPIERLISAYHHGVGALMIDSNLTLDSAVREASRGTQKKWVRDLLSIGLYGPQLERLLAHFPRQQVQLVEFREFTNPTQGHPVRSELLHFCGLDEALSQEPPKVNIRGNWERAQGKANTDLSEETIDFLGGYYKSSNSATERIFGRPLGWGGQT